MRAKVTVIKAFCVLLFLVVLIVPALSSNHFFTWYSAPPTSFNCTDTLFSADDATLEWDLGTGLTVVGIEYINGAQYRTFTPAITSGSGTQTTNIVSGTFATTSFPYIWMRESIVSDAGGEISRSLIEIQCTGPTTATVLRRQLTFTTPPSSPPPPSTTTTTMSSVPTVSCPAFADGRINNCDTAAPVAVYPSAVNGETGLHVYSAEGELLLVVSPEQIADVPDNPDSNLLVAANAGVALYRITGITHGGTSQWQINAPQYNGKTYVLIFNDLVSDNTYTSYEIE